jgi:hypothetical protein
MSTERVHAILLKDLLLCKKSTRWLPTLIDKKMKKEQVRMCKAFIAMIPAVP